MRFDWKEILLLCLIALLFVTIMSSTSFLYDYWYPLDSTIYQIIGKGWIEGKIPYVDLWDQKGPLLYLINALGYLITGNKYGLFIIEIIVYICFFLACYYFFRKIFTSGKAIALMTLVACHLSQLMAGGNNIEQYVLPALMITFIHVWEWAEKFSKEHQVIHSWKWAFFFGFILSACMLTRLTNAVGICIAFGVIVICLFYYKQWKDLGYNIMGFLLGFFFLSVPFWAYFYMHDGLYELFYATILFNMDYLNDSNLNIGTAYELISKILAYVGTYGLLIVSLILCLYDKVRVQFHSIWTIISGFTLLYFLKTAMIEHYAIIAVPYYVIMMAEFHRLCYVLSPQKHCIVIVKRLAVAFCVIMFSNGCFQVYQALSRINQKTELIAQFDNDIISRKDIEKTQLICYGLHPLVYLHNHITPICRFFALQDSYTKHSESLRPKVINSLYQAKPKHILLGRTTKEPLIKDFYIRYNPIDSLACGILYVLNCQSDKYE